MKFTEFTALIAQQRKILAAKLSNEFLLRTGFTISILVLFYVSFISYDTNKALIRNANWVDHTHELIRRFNNILISVKDAQLAQKDYLITNDEKHLANYYPAHEMMNSELITIKSLIIDNSSQLENIKKAEALATEIFKKWDAIIELKKNNTFIYGQSPSIADADKLVSKILAMRYDEMNLLNIRAKKYENTTSEAPTLLIFLALISLGFTVAFYFIINANIKKIRTVALEKQEAFEEAQLINEELSATTKELKDSLDKINIYKEDLEFSKERLLEAQNIANMGNWEWNIVTNDIYWSENLIQIFDHDPKSNEKFDYQTYLSLLHPDDKPMIENAVQEVLNTHKPYIVEHRLITKSGNTKWLLSKGKVILSEDGKAEKLMGTAIDITELKYAQTEEEKLVAVVNNSSDFMGLGDKEGNLIFINKAGRKLSGLDYSRKVETTNILDYLPEEEKNFAIEHVMPLVIDTGRWSGELNFQNFTTKELVPVCWNAFIVKDQANDTIGIGHIVQDMRTEKKNRNELQVKNEELFASVEELKQAEENLMLMNTQLELLVEERSKALSISEERFRMVSLATNDAIWDWDLQTDKLWWNEGFKSMFGYKAEQIEVGIESLHNRIHPEDKFKILKEIRQHLNSKKSQWTGEYRFLNSTANYIHVMDRGYILRNEEGKPYRMLGSLINISERKEIELERTQLHEKAEAQRVRLYEMLMNIPAGITIMKGRDLEYEMVNNYYKVLLNITANNSLIGKSRKSLSMHSASDEMLKILTEVYNTGMPSYSKEFQTNIKNNGADNYIYSNVLVEPMFDNEHNIEGIMTFTVDVTEHVLARKQVEESAEKMGIMFEAIPQMAWQAQPDGTITYFNNKWYEFTGSNFTELQYGWVNYLHPDDREFTNTSWNHSLTTGDTYELEYRWLRASDNTYRWMLGRAKPVKNTNGDIILWVGTCTDIHDQKQTYAELDNKNQELIKVNELLDTFVYTAAHDLKSPVINLKSLFELINETEDQAMRQQYFKTIDVAINRLDDTISGLVEVIEVRSEDNKIAKIISFDEILKSVLADFDSNLTAMNGTIIANFNDCVEICYLKSYLTSIFTNLIGNAIKYRDVAKPLQIELSAYKENGYAVLTVKDNGTGIDLAKNGNRIFKAFNRFTRAAQGKGLGLYLIKTMVERNGGKLEVESELNVGTRFKLYLKEYR